LGMIVVDYLQLMKGKTKAESRQQEISDISRSLKALAKELNIPVHRRLTAQQERRGKQGMRPQLWTCANRVPLNRMRT